MDCDKLENIFRETEGFSIPYAENELFERLRKAAEQYDYNEILNIL